MKKNLICSRDWTTSKARKPLAKKQTLLLLGVFLLLLTSCGVRSTPTPETSSDGADSIVISTFTPAPADSPVSTETSMPTSGLTPNSEVMGQIPGLSPVNVTLNLEQRQFTCLAVRKGAVYYERTCTKGLPSTSLFQVVISGRESFIVDFIKTSVRQNENPDSQIASELLTLMATMPYDGATPDDAKAWVEGTIPTLSDKPDEAQESVFGDVKYKLYGPPTALTLEMGELPK